jgi:hypothetical protein
MGVNECIIASSGSDTVLKVKPIPQESGIKHGA